MPGPADQPTGFATWRLATPAGRPGAIAIVQVRGDVDRALTGSGIGAVGVGELRVRDLAGVDRGVVARVRADLAMLMPHGGHEIVRRLCAALTAAGIDRDREDSATARFPEARSPFEAEILDALARAASPRAIDLLLRQPARWRGSLGREPRPDDPAPDAEHSRRLSFLISPPMVVAVGASNIGKSTLLNRLSGRAIAAVADEPGTTRDHVGSLVDLDGLVVRWVDTPGIRGAAPALEREARRAADALLPGADLIVRLGDRGDPPPPAPGGAPSVPIALRRDLGRAPWEHRAAVSSLTGEGVPELAALLRRELIPDDALESPTPWRFWG